MAQWAERRPEEDFYRVLAPDGTPEREPPDLDEGTLLDLYRTFVRTRAFEDKALRLQRRGEISIAARCRGEEAVSLGSAAALEPGDWCFPSYRQTPAGFYWGARMDRSFAAAMGGEPETIDEHLPVDEEEAPPVNFTPVYVPLAVNVTNAVGSAMVDALGAGSGAATGDGDGGDAGHGGGDPEVGEAGGDGEGRTVTLSYIGDGSTSQGDFHEALNFAGVFEAPAVTVCQNNQWAISVPAHRQTAAETFAQKAEAHGVPHERVDGNDVFAVYEKTREAVERARAGGGPAFLECVTYRMVEHNTADEESVYRDEEETEFWADRDPVDRFEAYLRDRGVLDEGDPEAIREDAEAEVQQAVDRAREVPRPDPQRMFDHHLHGESWSERHQRAELRAEREGRNPFTDFTGEGLE